MSRRDAEDVGRQFRWGTGFFLFVLLVTFALAVISFAIDLSKLVMMRTHL
ncbi:MAG TPA: hypothetical protein VMY42_04560 [Thermoguttaceae bacterium]|nr:hypothetical protein [Thermoguttaceae bacterium]